MFNIIAAIILGIGVISFGLFLVIQSIKARRESEK